MKIFKPDTQEKSYLLPPSLDELIPSNHPARIINKVINGIDLSSLERSYTGGGSSSYHPKMLLKILTYSYYINIFSSRKIEQQTKENIVFMWLSGMQRPDHNTISRFRSNRLQEEFHKIFIQIGKLLINNRLISIQEVYLDGTKIEANANKYSFVWGNSIKTSKAKMKQQLEEFWQYACQMTKQDDSKSDSDIDIKDLTPEKIKDIIKQIDDKLKDTPADKKVKEKIKRAGKKWPNNLERYEKQEEIMSGRKSYSKTDVDATFMRMKEDHMQNSQLKAGYNVQVITKNQIILDYGIYQKPGDTTTLPSVVDQFIKSYGQKPEELVADAGYGSEENYEYLEKNDIGPLVKYNTYEKEEKIKKEKPFIQDNLYYNKKENFYVCPLGQRMDYIGERIKKSENGFEQKSSLYEAQNCTNCSLLSRCHKSQGNRRIEVNHNLIRLRKKARESMDSAEGNILVRRRKIDVEPVFGDIKQNMGIKRFLLRGKKKVAVEMGLVAVVHNLRKLFCHPGINDLNLTFQVA